MAKSLSDSDKLRAIGMWVFMRSFIIAGAYGLIKLGQYAVRFV